MIPYVANQNLTIVAVNDSSKRLPSGRPWRPSTTGPPGTESAADHVGRYSRAGASRRQDHRQPRCRTGTMAPAFLAAGTAAYIGLADYPDGSAALAFVANLFFLRTYDVPLEEAARRTAAFHPVCASSS